MRLDGHLAPRAANFRPLTPLDFLDRALRTHPAREAVVWRDRSWSYAAFGAMVGRLRDHLKARGIGRGDVVSVMAGNRPEMLAAHYAVPAMGAVLNAINTRLDTAGVAFIVDHAETRLFLADRDCETTARAALAEMDVPFEVFADPSEDAGLALVDGEEDPVGEPIGLADAITDEWAPIGLNYTSGTTGNPKGVALHHRGACLNALGNVMALGFNADTRYLWTLPMFHCNGWCHTWAVTAAGGTHICLDKVDPALIFDTLTRQAVTHMSCAPVVLYILLGHDGAGDYASDRRVIVATGGAAPTSRLIADMEALNFDFIHLYGLTECYGPTSLRVLDATEAGVEPEHKAVLLARQGGPHVTANRIRVIDENGRDVPADGATTGEIALTGNTLFAGYHRNPEATEEAFSEAGFRTGDIAVMHPGGDIEIRDRAKDVIISGGENISSLEVESVLHRHAGVRLAAVVARPDPKWGEVPCAFIEPAEGHPPTAEELRAHCRAALAGFKVPRHYILGELPKTATGKIRKVELRHRARREAIG